MMRMNIEQCTMNTYIQHSFFLCNSSDVRCWCTWITVTRVCVDSVDFFLIFSVPHPTLNDVDNEILPFCERNDTVRRDKWGGFRGCPWDLCIKYNALIIIVVCENGPGCSYRRPAAKYNLYNYIGRRSRDWGDDRHNTHPTSINDDIWDQLGVVVRRRCDCKPDDLLY